MVEEEKVHSQTNPGYAYGDGEPVSEHSQLRSTLGSHSIFFTFSLLLRGGWGE